LSRRGAVGGVDVDALRAESARELSRVSADVECDLLRMRMVLRRVERAIASLERRKALYALCAPRATPRGEARP
jgi:hypothetical protein